MQQGFNRSHPVRIDNQSEPAGTFYEADADIDVGRHLAAHDEVGGLVSDVRGSVALLDWLAGQEIPAHLRRSFRALDMQARDLSRMVYERVAQMERAS